MSHSAGMSGGDFSGAAVFKPTVAASVWKTFGVLTGLLYFGAWMISLPAELILHRRVGKRYMNSFFFACSFVLLSVITAGLIHACLPGPIREIAAKGVEALPAPVAMSATTLGFVMLASIIAFAIHKFANRMRFGTPVQGHSFDAGIPHLAYLPFSQKVAKFLLDQMPPEPPEFASRPEASVMEMESFPLAVLKRFHRYVRHHLSALAEGAAPYGPVTWLVISIVEPLLLAAFGIALLASVSLATPFGWYLVLLAAAILFKALMHRADWMERAYNDVDQRLEAEALKQWRVGKPATAFSNVFTVPISEAVLPRLPQALDSVVGETLFDADRISGVVGADGKITPHNTNVPRTLLWEEVAGTGSNERL
jgi:hypothetical protein